MQLFVKYFEGLTLKLAWLAAWLFVLSGIMLSYEVVARYFFLAPTKWAAEHQQHRETHGCCKQKMMRRSKTQAG